MSAATKQGVNEITKEAARMLSEIPFKELEIAEEDRYVEEERRFTYEINVEDGDDDNKVYIVSGTFVDRLLSAVNVEDPNSLRYFHKVLNNKGVFNDLREMGIVDGDIVRLNHFEFEYVL